MCFSSPLLPQSSRQHGPAVTDSQICGYIFTLHQLIHFHPGSSEFSSPCFKWIIFILLRVIYFHSILSDLIQLASSEFHPTPCTSMDVISTVLLYYFHPASLEFTLRRELFDIDLQLMNFSSESVILWIHMFLVKSTWARHIWSWCILLVSYLDVIPSSEFFYCKISPFFNMYIWRYTNISCMNV